MLLEFLTKTYPYYVDRASRRGVQDCLRGIVQPDAPEVDIASLTEFLGREAKKNTLAPASIFVLVEWCSILIQQLAPDSALWNKWGLQVVQHQAKLLESCLATNLRDSRKHAALVTTRRAWRVVAKSGDIRDIALTSSLAQLTSKGVSPTAHNAILIGVIAGVAARISSARPVIASNKSVVYGFYAREILGSRTVVPIHIADGLHDFFNNFATAEDIQKEVIAVAEKALLRAPEVLLNEVLALFIKSLPADIDMSQTLQGHLVKPLLSNVKSTNQTIRDGARAVFRELAVRSHDNASLTTVVEDISKALKDAKSVDHRTVFCAMLASLRPSGVTSPKILGALSPLAVKEAAELPLASELAGISAHAEYLLAEGTSLEASIPKAFAQGLGDKKPSTRRLWTLAFGDTLAHLKPGVLKSKAVADFIEPCLEKLVVIWDEVLANPVATTQTSLVTAAYVVAVLALDCLKHTDSSAVSSFLKKIAAEKHVIGSDTKPSFVLNSRVYSKLTSDIDILWATRALGAAARLVCEPNAPVFAGDAWSQAMIFTITTPTISASIRHSVQDIILSSYKAKSGLLTSIMLRGIWQWLQSSYLEEKDTAASVSKYDTSRLYLVVQAICPSGDEMSKRGINIDKVALEQQLLGLHILCRQPLIPRVNWIELCLKLGMDPAAIVSEHKDQFFQNITEHTQDDSNPFTSIVYRAACDAAAELAFIAPDIVNERLTAIIRDSLDPSQLDDIGATEAGIFRTPEGVTFIDVLSQSSNFVPDKNVKDYETLKWEQEVRAQLEAKQGKQKKLTSDEQAKVNAQLAKEAKIRGEVSAVASNLRRGIGLISSLAQGPPTDAESWMGLAADSLFRAIKNGAGLIVGEAAALTYLELADKVAARIGTLRPFIGVATLRAQGVSHLPDELAQEPIGDLVTRVLYRLRFNGEQRPFDVTSLSYMLPLMTIVLEKGGIERQTGEEADEQITLALEFIATHADSFSNHNLPRRDVCALLVRSMQRYNQHYRLLKDCLTGICHAIAPDATEEEINVYLEGAIVPETSVRGACLQAIDAELSLPEDTFCIEIWLACHESDEENAAIAETIREENSLKTDHHSSFAIIPYLESKDWPLRNAAARALAACVKDHRTVFDDVLIQLKEVYTEQAKPRVPERDQYGMPRKMDLSDPWESRHGVALAIKELASIFASGKLVDFVRFLVERGPLADRNSTVRDAMVGAATALITLKGGPHLEDLMKTFETSLEALGSSSQDQDLVNEAVIIMYGALARHLKAGDVRIDKVVTRLLATLSTPSENVQYAIAGCLPPLIQMSPDKTSEYVGQVMDELLNGKKYANRRGAAYGLAGIVSGKGIGALREFRILSSLRTATEDKKDSNRRQGAFLAFELLSLVLGPIFEPYVIQVVPQLLTGFGDASADVRESCLDAAKTCFASLSSYGVKQVLPTLLEGLEEVQWRSKKGACDSLGAMAYLAPQQLAISLPEIIPPLTTVLNDSHKEVRGAANRSLKRFGEVISNPEIKSLVDILLKALSDPTKYTDEALDALLKINFAHYLDAPSLALVVRILERGLGDRSNTKRKASQIIGSLAHLTDRKDLAAHLPILVAGLRIAAVDPVPTTRATSSKALGSLVEKLGEDALPDLIPSLMAALKTDTGAGDRLGSAQALSEVLAGLGTSRLEETLPSILQNITSAKASVREGFMSLFIFLPACFGNSFANYLSRVIPPILSGLADDIESIRETSLRAGRLLVKNFATKAIDLLLPELIRGMADDSHRIRLSSVELVGDLLFNLTGISAAAEDEDAEEGAASAGQSLLDVLGEEKRNNVLSALYISRSDTSGLVRTAAMQVWKALVATPRTLREITPTLTQVLIRRLASSNMEQKIIASNALGELIRKAGEGVLATLLPTLEESLETSVDPDSKQGICIALKELISSASPETLEVHEAKLISIVKDALVDPNANVRDAAAEAFDSLQQLFGKRVIDQILPNLLSLLRQEDEADNALAALLTLLEEATRSNVILPNLLPTLLHSPISAFNARALASLASVAGSSMTRRLSNILNSLLDNIITCKEEERLETLNSAFDTVMLSVDEHDGLNTLMSAMLALSKHDDHRKRQSADLHLANFFGKAEGLDYSRYYPDLIRALLISFDDSDTEVVKAAWTALHALISSMGKNEMESLVPSTRQVLSHVGVAGHNLPGFCLPKGINAVLPIFLQGLINGPPEQRTQAALAISDIIDKTSPDALKPFVTQITGPLIRVVSERSVEVRAAIMLTLNKLLEKIPAFVKPFLPQLQRSFTKALADTSSELLRNRAAKALGTLITLTPRIDPLIGELVAGSKTPDQGVSNAMQKALYEVVSKVGANMGENSRTAILTLVDDDSAEVDEGTAITNARLLGALIKNLSPETAAGIVKSRVCTTHHSRASVLALNSILLESPTTLTEAFGTETVSTIVKGIGSREPLIAENCIIAAGKYLLTETSNKSFEVCKNIFEALVPTMQPGCPVDARRLALVVIRTVSRENNDLVRPHIALLAPPIFGSVRDMIIPVKLASEAAFLSLFSIVDDEDTVFEKYMAGPGAELAPNVKRSMQDYFKRVATRLAGQARERRDAEGGQSGLGLSNDEREDEREIWSVGKVDLGEASFDA